MLYGFGTTEEAIGQVLLFLTDKDLTILRSGRTLFVDREHQKIPPFTGVHIGYFPTSQEALAVLDSLKGNPKISLKEPQANEGELKCGGCGGIMRPETLLKGRCIVCWYEAYQRLLGG